MDGADHKTYSEFSKERKEELERDHWKNRTPFLSSTKNAHKSRKARAAAHANYEVLETRESRREEQEVPESVEEEG